jgi:hypothetical protein
MKTPFESLLMVGLCTLASAGCSQKHTDGRAGTQPATATLTNEPPLLVSSANVDMAERRLSNILAESHALLDGVRQSINGQWEVTPSFMVGKGVSLNWLIGEGDNGTIVVFVDKMENGKRVNEPTKAVGLRTGDRIEFKYVIESPGSADDPRDTDVSAYHCQFTGRLDPRKGDEGYCSMSGEYRIEMKWSARRLALAASVGWAERPYLNTGLWVGKRMKTTAEK